jgi:hypothetical protein
MRRHPRRAEVDPSAPAAWATSDRSGFVGNHVDLRWQHEYAGFDIVSQNFLVFPDEYDTPNRQLGALILPPDPPPVMNARPEQYAIDETPISTRVTMGGDVRIIMSVHAPYRQRTIMDETI